MLLDYGFIVLCFALCFCGCKTVEKQVSVDREVRVVERDTTVLIAPDSSLIRAYLECDSLNNVILRGLDVVSGARLKVNGVFQTQSPSVAPSPRLSSGVINGVVPLGTRGAILSFDCKEDSLRQVIECYDSIISTTKASTEIQYVRRRNGYDKFVSVGFWVLLVLVIGTIAIKIYLHKL